MFMLCDNVNQSAVRSRTPKGYTPLHVGLSHTGAAAFLKGATMICCKCLECGKAFDVKRDRGQKYCSRGCMGLAVGRQRIGPKHHNWAKRYRVRQLGEELVGSMGV